MSTFHRAEEVFSAALERPEPEREEFVRVTCGEDARLCADVLALLRARHEMGGFLEKTLTDPAGQVFGAWRAEEEIGRGGMSIVYRGSRADGGFDKQVAIKVVFVQSARAAETRLLATLEHPNVARLLDGGLTPLGFPYLVMELVKGEPITVFGRRLNEEGRLRLFLQVCAGVQAAHGALIVHRDLKPDNILVNEAGQVKLLDFGIAKMLEPVGDQTAGPRGYSPGYASPEQMEGRPASTANDIYSLGILLRELFAGQPLTGDLSVIASKAARADPAERYATVSDLAGDIERYLHQEPIAARPAAWTYHARQFARRHRYAVLAGTAAALALTALTAVAWRQKKLAEERTEQVHRLARKVLFDLEEAVSRLPGSIPARQLIIKESLAYLDGLSQDESASDAVQLDAARGYVRLADVFGRDRSFENLGQPGDALRCLNKAEVLARRVAARSPDGDGLSVLSSILESRAAAQGLLGQFKEAVESAQGAVAVAEDERRRHPASLPAQERLALALVRLSDARQAVRADSSASEPLERAIRLFEELRRSQPAKEQYRQRLARAHQYLGNQAYGVRDFDRAARHGEAALGLSRALAGENPVRYRSQYAADLGLAAGLAGQRKQFPEALALLEEQLAVRRAMQADHPEDRSTAVRVAATLDRICTVHFRAKDHAAAITACQAARAQLRALVGTGPGTTLANGELLNALIDLGRAYEAAGDGRQACGSFTEAADLVARVGNLGSSSRNYMAVAKEKAAQCHGK